MDVRMNPAMRFAGAKLMKLDSYVTTTQIPSQVDVKTMPIPGLDGKKAQIAVTPLSIAARTAIENVEKGGVRIPYTDKDLIQSALKRAQEEGKLSSNEPVNIIRKPEGKKTRVTVQRLGTPLVSVLA